MYCKKCGRLLNEGENICPSCGTAVGSEQPQNVQQPVEPQMAQQPVGPQMVQQPVEPQMAQQPVGPQMPAQNQMMGQTGKTKNDKMILLIIILALVIIIAVILGVILFNKNNKNSNEDKTNTATQSTDNNAPTPVVSQNTETHAGYTFVIPDGYKGEVTEDGLVVSNNDLAFNVDVDYFSYEETKAELIQITQKPESELVTNINGREYCGYYAQSKDGIMMGVYATKATDSSTFYGVIVKHDNSMATYNDFVVINNILDNAKSGSSSFAPSNESKESKIKNIDVNKFNYSFDNK